MSGLAKRYGHIVLHIKLTQSTPYSLVYRVEAVLPLELQIPSLRVAIQEGLTNEKNAKLHLA